MPSSSLPLLRLPMLALREIFKNIALRELFLLSLCSNRMFRAAKNFRDKSVDPVLEVNGKPDIEIHLYNKTNRINLTVNAIRNNLQEFWRINRIGGKVAYIQERENSSYLTYWEDEVHGTKAVVEYISDLFGIGVELLNLDGARVWMLDFAEQRQGPGSYKAAVKFLTEEQLKHILVDLNPKSLTLDFTPPTFRIENFNKKYDEFQLFEGKWITFEHLCTLDSIEIRILEKFEGVKINQYFQNVMAGGAPRLKMFVCRVLDGFRENVILSKIRKMLTAVPGREQFTRDHQGNWEFNGRWNRGEDSLLVTINYTSFFQVIRLIISEM